MTKENREKLYKHFRNLEKNYEAREGLNSGPTATASVRARAKESADEILKKHPELKPLDNFETVEEYHKFLEEEEAKRIKAEAKAKAEKEKLIMKEENKKEETLEEKPNPPTTDKSEEESKKKTKPKGKK